MKVEIADFVDCWYLVKNGEQQYCGLHSFAYTKLYQVLPLLRWLRSRAVRDVPHMYSVQNDCQLYRMLFYVIPDLSLKFTLSWLNKSFEIGMRQSNSEWLWIIFIFFNFYSKLRPAQQWNLWTIKKRSCIFLYRILVLFYTCQNCTHSHPNIGQRLNISCFTSNCNGGFWCRGVFEGLDDVYTLPLTYEKGKRGRVVPVHALKANRRSTCLAPHILDLFASWRWVVNVTPRALYSHEKTPLPIQ